MEKLVTGKNMALDTSKGRLVGNRCHICTGCGRCFGQAQGMTIVADGGLLKVWQEQCAFSEESRKLVAVDIGTTTVAMALFGRDGKEEGRFATVNPQVKYGRDVLSRIQAAGNPADAEVMKTGIRKVLVQGLNHLKEQAAADRGGEGLSNDDWKLMIAGNTTMTYLLMGDDPAELGRVPFHASHLKKREIKLGEMTGEVFGGLSAFVGGDILAGIYAGEMAEREDITLFIDLGTNGEMALGNRDRIIACSTAAGPAFEGGVTTGVWGADMVHLTAELLRKGLVDDTGLLADEYFEEGVLIGNVRVTQQSIRNLQLAKAAIAAGIGTLALKYGLSDIAQIKRVVLAGGFGYFLQSEDAAAIGLIPRVLSHKVESGGNTALAGIFRYGFCEKTEAQSAIDDIVDKTTVINLAEQDSFQDRYVEAMNLEDAVMV